MGEGFGDYWAGSYSRSKNATYQPTFVFNWDGHNEFWGGRLLIDSTLRYPQHCCTSIYVGGTLWCSALWNGLIVVGRGVMDVLVLDHIYALGTGATMPDAVNQILQSDTDIYGGAHVAALTGVFQYWGFLGGQTAVAPGEVPVRLASLGASSPNPAGPEGATIRFALGRASRATLAIFDASGRRVRTLVDGDLAGGEHAARWDGRDARGGLAAAGVYFYRLESGNFTSTQKLILLR
jgi:hypothetical protein